MKKGKEKNLIFRTLCIIVIISFIITNSFALIFEDSSQTDFNNGSYTNTTYNGTDVVLSNGNRTGSFTSRIFDAGIQQILWKNISWKGNISEKEYLLATDNQADVWRSDNLGATWTLIKDDYNGAAGNNIDGMNLDKSNNIYVVDTQDVWKSTDWGVTWTKVNDDFNGAGNSANGKSKTTDTNNNIYIIDGAEDVWKSTDGGTTFVNVATNFNGANGITPTLVAGKSLTNLTFQVKNCSSLDCTDAIFRGPDN